MENKLSVVEILGSRFVFFGFSCQFLRGDDQKILAHHKEAEVRGGGRGVLGPLYQRGGEAIIGRVKDLNHHKSCV